MPGWTPQTPPWVTPPPEQIDDAHWLTYRAFRETGRESIGGAAAAIAWVRGGRNGPITERDEQPVTLHLARAEMWAADAAMEGPHFDIPLGQLYDTLGVAPWLPTDVSPAWATGVRGTLLWLTDPRGNGILPPMPVPIRGPTGDPLTSDELYDIGIRRQPNRYWLPEQRAELRHTADRLAAQYREMVDIIDDTKRLLAASN